MHTPIPHTLTILTIFLSTILALTTTPHPPSCLLSITSSTTSAWLSDTEDEKERYLTTLCRTRDITATIARACGSGAQEALSAFADLCNVGENVSNHTTLATLMSSISASAMVTSLPSPIPQPIGNGSADSNFSRVSVTATLSSTTVLEGPVLTVTASPACGGGGMNPQNR
ncbi:hypothetical protein P280DRAFT_553332 [Massarina eburnea CBS 473.64]|uniref:Uncharacterized protein n=1 Tax=Massarina eburnea CBS 473.64 TaxID=1395130 RepID=A0A6A6RLK5_9PLEO|nr:hypothetical protein P280DRAFT_553332 [Massarina eburnea CBS 473.64]